MSTSDDSRKRKLDLAESLNDSGKRLKLSSEKDSDYTDVVQSTSLQTEKKVLKGKRKKLNPPRPFASVPTSVSATGPRSSHREGKNVICVTRKTPLGSYLRRCKDIIIKDGYKTLYFSAMGAAVPQLLQLVCALPPILPFPQNEIKWEVLTGTTEVNDEMHPENESEDITYETRQKSTLAVTLRIGDGGFEGDTAAVRKYSAGKSVGKNVQGHRTTPGKATPKPKHGTLEGHNDVILEEPEQEFMDML